MYRYGDLNQLTFALPKTSTFQQYWPLKFHPSFVDTSLTFSTHADMLINPTYQYETLKRFMPKVMVQCGIVVFGASVFLLHDHGFHPHFRLTKRSCKKSKSTFRPKSWVVGFTGFLANGTLNCQE